MTNASFSWLNLKNGLSAVIVNSKFDGNGKYSEHGKLEDKIAIWRTVEGLDLVSIFKYITFPNF